jgi:hypothetical protein
VGKDKKNKSRKKGVRAKANPQTVKRIPVCPRTVDPRTDCAVCALKDVCDDPGRLFSLENKCDTCLYEFGSCDGVPEFAGDESDRVVSCTGWKFITGTKPTVTVVPEEQIPPENITENIPKQLEANKKAPVKPVENPLLRFKRKEDFGKCLSCQSPLKRTAYNRDRDAIRCTNPRCPQYRNIVRSVPAK